jgi:hypothetical protein
MQPSLPKEIILKFISRYSVHIVLLSTDIIKNVLGVVQWVRTEHNTEFAILASNPVTIPFTRKLYRKGGADCSCYSTASCKTEH